MKQKMIFLLAFLLIVAACAPSPDEPVSNEPVAGNTPAAAPQQNDFLPNPADDALTRGEVFLDVKGISSLESYPLQIMLLLEGNLPTPCHQLRINVNPPDADNKINIDVYSVFSPDKICIQVLVPFEVSFNMGSYPPGEYSVLVNGEPAGSFLQN
jgi:hypothetical protein